MTSRRNKIIALVAAVVVAIGAAGVAVAVTTANSGPTLTAVFADANPIVPGDYARLSGVKVGEVESTDIVDGKAVVKIALDDKIAIHQDATAAITSNNLLGERFIQINGGSPNAPLMPEPYTIQQPNTRSRVDILDVLNSVDDPTGKALGMMLTSLGEGVQGKGDKAAQAIERLAPAMKQTDQLSKILNDQNGTLNRLVDNVQPVTTALEGNQGTQLDRLVGSTTQTLGTVASQRQATQETLRQLPSTLQEARARLAQLSGVAAPTTDTLRSLRPVTDQVSDISGELEKFSESADPALASLQPVLDRGTEMLQEARPLIHDLRPAGSDVRDIAKSGRELTPNVLGDRLTDLMEFMKGWSLATSDYDAVSHYFKAIVPLSPSPAASGALGSLPVPNDPLKGLPVPQPKALPLPGVTGGDTSAGKDNRAGNGPDPTANGSATGLDKNQEHAMVDQLLGGK